MSREQDWNDQERYRLRVQLQWQIVGEVRLARKDHQSIFDACRKDIERECPESERNSFTQWMADELDRAEAQHAAEKLNWPEVTDCDRLDRAEDALRRRGILLWQVSPCCDSCTVAELPGRLNVINGRHPGFRDRLRGYAFFIDQNMPQELWEGTELSIYLGYGWCEPENSKVAEKTYKKNALGIASEIFDCLRNEGLKVDWNGSFDQKIGLSMNWQRRELLN